MFNIELLKKIILILIVGSVVFLLDQYTKEIFIQGYRYSSSCIDLTLVYNDGVAFSMFAFLKHYLKYIQLLLIGAFMIYALFFAQKCYLVAFGMIFGAALSNVYDRFIHGGVVDMVFWHCGFNFAIFNLADVLIDVAVVWILFLNFKPKFCKS